MTPLHVGLAPETSGATLDNPYYDEFVAVSGDGVFDCPSGADAVLISLEHAAARRRLRHELVRRYAWAVPSEEVIRQIAAYGPIIEVGAGTGYWASLLSQAGADVMAFDLDPAGPENATRFHEAVSYFPVLPGGPEVADRYPERALLLCWPPYESSMAADALRHYQGHTVIYVGEGPGGCTADDEFHRLLDERFSLIERLGIPRWESMDDDVRVYHR